MRRSSLLWVALAVAPVALIFLGSASTGQQQRENKQQVILQIQDLISKDNLNEAKRLLDLAATKYSKDAGFDNLRGVVAAKEGNIELALRSFKEAVALLPSFTAASLNLGRLYQEQDVQDPAREQKALHAYEQVLKYDPGNAEAQYQSAFLLLRQRSYRDSLMHLSKLSPEMRSLPQALSVAVADHAALGQNPEASEAAMLLAQQPDMAVPDVQQAVPSLLAAKRFDLIVELLEALDRQQHLPQDMLPLLASGYQQTDQTSKARATLERAFAAAPTSTEFLMELAKLAYQQKDYKGSLGYLAHAQDLAPNDPIIAYSFGVACLNLNLLGESQKAFKKAVDLAPENASYNYAAGITTSFISNPEEAVPYLEKYVKLLPGDPKGELAIGAIFCRAKEYDAAIPWLQRAAKQPETAATAYYYLGRAANEQGRPADAIPQLQHALQGDPRYADAFAELGQSYLLLRDYPKAEQALQNALTIDRNHYLANFALLTVYVRTKDERQQAQAKRFAEIQKSLAEENQEYLRVIKIQPLDAPAQSSPSSTVDSGTERAGYVGDAGCIACHQVKSQSYLQTSHHFTSQPANKQSVLGSFQAGSNVLMIADPAKVGAERGIYFKMGEKDGSYYETAVSGWGTELQSEPIDIVTGSGKRGSTYLYWKGDKLYELPVSYWSEGKKWINSPGYEDGSADFFRPINPRCLECHATYIRPLSPDPLTNRYEKSSLVTGISCETCHGPGADHVAGEKGPSGKPGGPADHAMLNPATFSRDRQVDLCALCHNGIQRRETAPSFSYIPGQPLDNYFKPIGPDTTEHPDVHGNQVGLLQRSLCYRSSPKMSCSTCHDVHAPEQPAAAYSARCLTCHRWESCGVSKKMGHQIVNDCINCHMPLETTQAIVSTTAGKALQPRMRNHWIKIYPGQHTQ